MPPAPTTSCGRPESSFCQFLALGNTLGIDETTLSPAATRMTAAAAARVSFKEASTLLDELAGLALDPKQGDVPDAVELELM